MAHSNKVGWKRCSSLEIPPTVECTEDDIIRATSWQGPLTNKQSSRCICNRQIGLVLDETVRVVNLKKKVHCMCLASTFYKWKSACGNV
eukprot:172772-Rhodomonas_salina.13